MTKTGIRLLAGVLLVLTMTAPRASAQEVGSGWSVDELSAKSPEMLLTYFRHYQNIVNTYPGAAPYGSEAARGTSFEDHWNAYIDSARAILVNVRDALVRRGVRPPAQIVAAPNAATSATAAAGAGAGSGGSGGGRGGSNTLQIEGAGGNRGGTNTQTIPVGGGPAARAKAALGLASPVAVMASAGDLARCGMDGVAASDCLLSLAAYGAVGLPIGAAVVILAPSGAVILTAWTVVSSVGSVVMAVDQAAGNYSSDVLKEANAARITKEAMDRIVATYTQRLAEARGTLPDYGPVDDAANELARVVERARDAFSAFEGSNQTTKLASARCSDPSRQPLTYAAEADERLTHIERQADAIAQTVGEAVRSVAQCTAAQQAKASYERAQRDLIALQGLGNDARADLQDASSYFAAVTAAKASMPDAARRIAELEQLVEEAGRARSRVSDATADYQRGVAPLADAVGSVLVGLHNLRGALPAELPPHIKEGFQHIDDAYTREASDVLLQSKLNTLDREAGDDVSRVEGWLRLAKAQFDDLRACGLVTGEMPEALRLDLARMATGLANAYARADQAVNDGKEIPAKADACAQTTSVVPPSLTRAVDGRMAGECTGSIRAVPDRATVGSQLMIQVAIDPPFDTVITRVATDNPACRDNPACDAQRTSQGLFRATLRFEAPSGAAAGGAELGRFRVRFAAYDTDNRIRCTGQTPELTVLAPARR